MRGRRFVVVALMTVLAGCATSKPPHLSVRADAADCARPVDTLIVMLPGAYDQAAEYIGQGFVDAVRQRDIAADVALVEASVAYYRDRDIVDRLHDDVVAPAQARGIRHVWFAGISIGGLGSFIYANERPGDVEGLLLIAPYLGERATVAEVAASGGLARWAPPGTIPDDDTDRRIWQSMKKLTVDDRDPSVPVTYLGYGVDDRFAAGHRLLAEVLPRDRVFTAPGGHDWSAWRAVWPRMLDAAPLPHGCRGTSR